MNQFEQTTTPPSPFEGTFSEKDQESRAEIERKSTAARRMFWLLIVLCVVAAAFVCWEIADAAFGI